MFDTIVIIVLDELLDTFHICDVIESIQRTRVNSSKTEHIRSETPRQPTRLVIVAVESSQGQSEHSVAVVGAAAVVLSGAELQLALFRSVADDAAAL